MQFSARRDPAIALRVRYGDCSYNITGTKANTIKETLLSVTSLSLGTQCSYHSLFITNLHITGIGLYNSNEFFFSGHVY